MMHSQKITLFEGHGFEIEADYEYDYRPAVPAHGVPHLGTYDPGTGSEITEARIVSVAVWEEGRCVGTYPPPPWIEKLFLSDDFLYEHLNLE